MWTTDALKKRFIDFFKQRGHVELPSSSIIPNNDPTLLFTNSGMVQFKDIFMGEKTNYKRVCTSQRCIRAGGKHNDLEDVGKDNYHHTFFEMLGNWSFGDYFKEEAIEFAYKFLVEDLKLDRDRLYVTIYEEMDKESKNIWKKYLDESKIISASVKDNFWEMGDFGPCGPCTEIHYDRIGGRDASSLVNKDDPNVLEIWNIVFMEYERTPKGLEKLKVKNIDTGIGLERLLSILMGVDSNYKIDSFQNIIKFIETKCDFIFKDGSSIEDVAFRVLADHARTLAVCLNDKVGFSNDGVGYVVRRILRRAIRYANDILKLQRGVLSEAVNKAGKFMGFRLDVSVINDEENLFFKTLVKGKNQYNKIKQEKGKLNGADVFLLYDTYGFPKDLTELMAREDGIEINMDGFEEARNIARDLSKSVKNIITINFDFEKTDDSYKYKRMNGISANLMAAVLNNEIVNDISVNQAATLIFDKTCFYGECGGQVGDTGIIEFYENDKIVGVFEVTDTQLQRGYVFHIGKLLNGKIFKSAKLVYDENMRQLIASNHSTTHILNYFLRKYISTEQEGSLVDSEKCRFDFEGKKLSDKDLFELEDLINRFVQSNAKVSVDVFDREDVLNDKSIIKMSNEKYPDKVRVITMKNEEHTIKEICGGTHVSNTSEIKLVRLMSETGVKANTRRIVAVSNITAMKVKEIGEEMLRQAQQGKSVSLHSCLSIKDRKKLDELNNLNLKKNAFELKQLTKAVETKIDENVKNQKFYVKELNEFENLSSKEKKKIFSDISKKVSSENEFFLYILINESYDISILSKKNESIFNILQSNFEGCNFRFNNNLIQGSIPYNIFNVEKILSLLKN